MPFFFHRCLMSFLFLFHLCIAAFVFFAIFFFANFLWVLGAIFLVHLVFQGPAGFKGEVFCPKMSFVLFCPLSLCPLCFLRPLSLCRLSLWAASVSVAARERIWMIASSSIRSPFRSKKSPSSRLYNPKKNKKYSNKNPKKAKNIATIIQKRQKI